MTTNSSLLARADVVPAVEKQRQQAMVSTTGTRLALLAGASLTLFLGWIPQGHAQAQVPVADDGAPGEIVVTAQKREQSAQKVGISITAASSEDLLQLNVVDSRAITRIAPAVTLNDAGGGTSSFAIRGVSQSDYSATQESPNSVYVDEVYLASGWEAGFPLYDLQRVEVLRGPQGTLFGRASSGGLISFITARPTERLEGYAEMGFGSYSQGWAEGAFSGPLSDGIRFRLAGRAEQNNGWWRNLNPGLKNTQEKAFFGVRGQIEADITNSLTARISLSYDKSPRHREGGNYQPTVFYINDEGQPAPLPADVDAYGTGPGNNLFGYRAPPSSRPVGAPEDTAYAAKQRFAPTLHLSWEGDGFSVTSISNYTFFKGYYNDECDGSPLASCLFPSATRLKQWSEELRINGSTGPLTYTAGIYILDISQSLDQQFITFPGVDNDFAFVSFNAVKQDLRSYSAFGQAEYELSPALKLTVGGRYTHDRKTFSSVAGFNELGNGFSGGTGSTVFDPPLIVYDFSQASVGDLARARKGMWSGKAQLDYSPSSDILLYAGVSRGVKGPGFNTNVASTGTNAQTPFGAEHLYAYEAGLKTQLFDRLLRFNLSGYYYDYHDYQGYTLTAVESRVGNYRAAFYGGEAEATLRLPQDLTASVGLAYLHTKVRDVETLYSGTQAERAVMAPTWTVTGNVTKSFDLSGNPLALTWSFDYIGKRYASLDNNAATLVRGSFVHNARVSYKLEDAGVEFALFCNNISNVSRQAFSYNLIGSTGDVTRSYAPPRWFGGSVRKTF